MSLPFTIDQFLEVFRNYNQYIFPLQIVFYLLAAIIIFLLIKKLPGRNRIINAILSLFWLWMGIVYHILFFAAINKAAYLFGSLFIIQGILFFYFGVIKEKLSYQFRSDGAGWIGILLMAFALIAYPLLGYLFGHVYPCSPSFGAPCPTTIFTLGVLLCSESRMAKSSVIIPFLWSLLGFTAAMKLGIYEDSGLVIAGIIATGIIWLQNTNLQPPIYR